MKERITHLLIRIVWLRWLSQPRQPRRLRLAPCALCLMPQVARANIWNSRDDNFTSVGRTGSGSAKFFPDSAASPLQRPWVNFPSFVARQSFLKASATSSINSTGALIHSPIHPTSNLQLIIILMEVFPMPEQVEFA